jgi:5-methylcytosine-specific restriction endonuclease McrA
MHAEEARAAKLAEYYRDPTPFLARNLLRKARLLEAICEHGDDCVSARFLGGVYAEACTYCGAQAEHADHVVPISRGGLHCRENIAPACGPCNHSKWAHDVEEWLASRSA